MKKLILLALLAGTVALRSDEFFQNSDFSQGSANWGGSFDADSDAPKPGLTIHLKSGSWTTVTQDIHITSKLMVFNYTYAFSADATLSKNPDDYRDLVSRLGLPAGTPVGVMPGSCPLMLFDTGTGKAPSIAPIFPKLGSTDQQTFHLAFGYMTADNAKTAMLIFPPGTGTVTLFRVSGSNTANAASADPNPPSAGPKSPSVEYFQNGDFSKGTEGWTSTAQDAVPASSEGSPPSGLVFHLKPKDWTAIRQDVEIKSYKMHMTYTYAFSPDTVLSTDPEDYKNIGLRLGLNQWPSLGVLPGDCPIVQIGAPTDTYPLSYYPMHPKLGSADPQTLRNPFGYYSNDNTRTMVFAFPPGTGTVTIFKISGMGSPSDPPPAGGLPPGAQNANTSSSTSSSGSSPSDSSANEAIKNGDFSDGLSHWDGDIRRMSDLSTDDNSNPLAAIPNGGYVHLRGADWSNFSQNFECSSSKFRVNVTYGLTSGTTFSTDRSDYGNVVMAGIVSQSGISGTIAAEPGQWCLLLDDLDAGDWSHAFTTPNFNSTDPTTITAVFERSATPQGKEAITLKFPPGKGTVLIYRISAVPVN